jgi:VCBS repeat-containing protein
MLPHRRTPRRWSSALLRVGLLLALLLTSVLRPAVSFASGINPAKFESTATANFMGIRDSYVDADANVYITGSFDGSFDFDPGPGTTTLTSGASSLGDIFIAKYSGQGELAWAHRIAAGTSTYGQDASAIVADADGNVYVAGSFFGTIDFNPGAGSNTLSAQSGNTDAFLLKLNSAGAYQWAFDVGGGTSDTGDALAVDAAGNVYLTGSYYGSGVTAGSIGLPGGGGQKHLYVLKASPSGSITWAKGATGSNGDPNASDVAVDSSGNVYVGGNFFGLSFPGGPSLDSGYPTDYYDGFLWTLNSSGTTQGATLIGGLSNVSESVTQLAVDGDDNLYIAGWFGATVDFDPGAGTENRTAASNGSTYLLKLTSSGAFSRVQTWSGDNPANYDGLNIASMTVDASGNLLVAGSVGGSVDIDPGPATATRTSGAILFRLDSSGALTFDATTGAGGSLDSAYPLSNGTAMVFGNVSPLTTTGPTSVDVDPSSGTAYVSVPAYFEDPESGEQTWPGSAFFTVWALDGSGLGSAPGANVNPEFDDADDALSLSILEDAGAQDLAAALAASDSDADQSLSWSQQSAPAKGSFSVTSGTVNTPASGATPQSASYTPTANANGADSFSVRVADGNGNDTLSVSVTITAVNDEPALSLGGNQTANGADKGGVQQSVSGFATFDAGPADEDGGQSVADYLVSETSDPDGVVSGVDIANDGTLTYTPASNVSGAATISVQVQDNGGTANGGDDTSQASSFTISVNTYTPEIEVTGNGVTIADGDATPSGADHTDFGAAPANLGTVSRTFTIDNTALGALSVGSVSIGGANASDFSVTQQPASSVTPGGNTSFTVVFDPAAIGSRSASVSFSTNDGDEANFDFAIAGEGIREDSETSVSSSANPSSLGQSVTFTASVSGAASSVVPTGDVTFSNGATILGTVALDGSGKATLSTSALAVGSHEITVAYEGDALFEPSDSTALTQVVNKLSQTITFGALGDKTYGDAPFTVSATASSSLAVAFSSLTPAVCTVAGAQVTIVGAGTCTVRASQSGDADYGAAPNVDRSFNVAKAGQTITFGALGDKTYGDAPFTVSATTSSSLAIAFSSLTPAVCTVAGAQVTIVGAGACTVRASQPGNGDYEAAPNVDRSFNIAKAGQTITFGAPGDRIYGDAPFNLSATASSGLLVSFDTQTPSVCFVGAAQVVLFSAGTCTITASQAGDDNYEAATSVQRSFTVAKATPTVALSVTPSSSILGQSVELRASVEGVTPPALGSARRHGVGPSGPGGTITFKDGSVTLGTVALTQGEAVLATNTLPLGPHQITAEYSGDDNHSPASSGTKSHTVYATPLAVNDAAGTLEGVAVSIPVLENDIGPIAGFVVESVTAPAHGVAVIDAGDRSITYTPPAGFSGLVSFSYTLRYETYTDSGTVAVVVRSEEEAGESPEVAPVDPSQEGTVTFGGGDAPFRVTVELPAGVYAEPLGPTDIFYLAYTPVIMPQERIDLAPEGLRFGNVIFTLEAFLNDDQLEDFAFEQPVTLTISYDPDQMAGFDLDSLELRYWAGASWETDGITIVSHDKANHRITFTIAHLTEFALFAAPAEEPETIVYLPVIVR